MARPGLDLRWRLREQGRGPTRSTVTLGPRAASTISARSVLRMLLDTLAVFWLLRLRHAYEAT